MSEQYQWQRDLYLALHGGFAEEDGLFVWHPPVAVCYDDAPQKVGSRRNVLNQQARTAARKTRSDCHQEVREPAALQYGD
jgi:hypothetical protein